MRTASSRIPSNPIKKNHSNPRRISQVHILTETDRDRDRDRDRGAETERSQSFREEINNSANQKNHSFYENCALDGNFEDSSGNYGQLRDTKFHKLEAADDLYPHFRIFLIFGKLIGIIPWGGLFQKDVTQLKFKNLSVPGVISILITLLLALNAAVGLASFSQAKISTAADYARVPSYFIFYVSGVFIFGYFYKCSRRHIVILQQWNQMRLHYTKPDTRLKFDVNVLFLVIMTSAVLENIAGQLRIFPSISPPEKIDEVGGKDANLNFLELYYMKQGDYIAGRVPYNPILSLLLFVCNKFAFYAQNFMDITLAIFARAVYFKFKSLYIQAEKDLFGSGDHQHLSSNSFDFERWRKLCQDHSTLYKMTQLIGNLLSPLIFFSYSVNIYVLCLQLYLGLTPTGNSSTLSSVYAVWSFVHVIGRVYMVSLAAARINDWAHQVTDLFKRCPNESYVMEVERTERFVGANTIGFGGLGCFIITKPFILQIVSVVFTFEIVLLQATQTPFPAAGNLTVT